MYNHTTQQMHNNLFTKSHLFSTLLDSTQMKSKVDEMSCGCMDVTANKTLQTDNGHFILAAHILHMAHSMTALSPACFFGERSLFVILKEHIEYIVERSRNASTDTIVDELLKSRQTVHNCS